MGKTSQLRKGLRDTLCGWTEGARSLKQERAWLAQSTQLEGAGEGGQVTQSRPCKPDSRSRASF